MIGVYRPIPTGMSVSVKRSFSPSRVYHRLRLLVIAAFALAVAACSRTEMLYENADWLMLRWAGELVDASDAQREAWREPFAATMEEHRRRLLSSLIRWLDDAVEQIDKQPTTDDIACLMQRADTLYQAHAALALPLAQRVLGDLSAEQVAHLGDEMRERNDEYREDYLQEDQQERHDERVERYVDRLEYWTGDLTDMQVAMVREAVERMPDIAGPWFDYRQRQQQRLLQMLTQSTSTDELRVFLTAWWIARSDQSVVLVTQSEEFRQQWSVLLAQLIGAMSASQRETFADNIRKVRADLAVFIDERQPSLQVAHADMESCS